MKKKKKTLKRDTSAHTPQRQLARVDDATWQRLKNAARISGTTFSAWAMEALLIQAAREENTLKQGRKPQARKQQ